MKKNIFYVLSILIMLSILVVPATAQSGITPNIADELVAGEAVRTSGLAEVFNVDKASSYIIILEDPAVAQYSGMIEGLDATNPEVTGALRLDTHSPAALAYADYLQAQQSDLIQKTQDILNRDVKVNFQYFYALNALSVVLMPGEANQIARMPGVKQVEVNTWHEVTTDTGPTLMGAPGIWNGTTTGGLAGTYGEGVLVGILDTGINMDQPSFADVGADAYDHTNPFGTGNYLGWCNPSHPDYDATLVCTDKLIGVYDYADPYGETDGPNDNDGHGSHTASTTAGNFVDTTVEGFPTTISGVAPHANIIMYDVCVGGSCPTDSTIAGIEQAILDGVDVLNESIGIGGNTFSGSKQQAYLNAFAAGIAVSRSAGNSGPGAGTVGPEPVWTISTAASTHGRIFANTVDITGPTPVDAGLVGVGAQVGTGPTITQTISAGLLFDPTNTTGCTAFAADYFLGSLALISRGTCSFADKVNNATTAGAVGVIVFNSAGGAPIIMGALEATTIPAVMVDNLSGKAIRDWVLANPATTTATIGDTITRVVNTEWQDILGDFSSRGPGLVDVIKPDITSPGVNILAAYKTPEEFEFLQGTSMASPHTAGALALMRGLYPAWTPAELRSALMTSAMNDMLKEDAATPADPFDMGSGRTDLTKSALVGLVLNETSANFAAADPDIGGDPSSLNLASMASADCYQDCSWTRTVKNPTATTMVWSASYTGDGEGSFSVDTFTIFPGTSTKFDFSLDVKALEPETWYFGEIVWTEGSALAPDVKMPVAVYVKGSSDVNAFTKSDDADVIARGDTAAFSLTVTNNDYLSHTFTINDPVPANAKFVQGSASQGLEYVGADNALVASVELGPSTMEMGPTAVYGYLPLSNFFAPLGCSSTCDETIINITGLAPYYWNGEMYDSVAMVSNGYAIPGGGTVADVDYINQFLPDGTAPNNVLAPWWTDLDMDGTAPDDTGGGNWYAGVLTSGPYTFNILEWENAEMWGDPSSVYTFQIWMLSGTDFIWYAYGRIDGDLTYATVGAENAFGNVGVTMYYDGAGTLPAVGEEWEVLAVPGDSATYTFDLEATTAGAEILNEAYAKTEENDMYTAWSFVDTLMTGARLQVAHLAPFDMDPNTAVTITLDSTPILTDFTYGDSVKYLDLTAGTYEVGVYPNSGAASMFTQTLVLADGVDYTTVLVGDGAAQSFSLLTMTDDNSAPAAGKAHLRLGHLAPFAADPNTVADIRYDDGTLLLDDVSFGDVNAYVALPAGSYDLMITTADGTTTLVNLLPFTLNFGEVASAFAVGDGTNQVIQGFVLPADTLGYFVGEEFNFYLPMVDGITLP